ncbi:NAD(P)-dependent dehydrogenase (short-subunit alcohol dehydrogenase family) [Hydrogenophaga palleronii]|uniref:NAD(P)-dependent dehydrogenase (Short-subunit alcohol dehydrogenase family) n=1 Tax=Hydrogenophaga palleronii TaxID=65655 RepID=A0ABU1WRA7_9BURK|nr:hypothetical protein [Hydrogenophaga palleronii]MDR7151834.1 NAD(P)-dependent dehydrogenase (short-subunit alcohol dehydrogenase family) [Hydrogenophaga palleronii]
MEFKNKVVLIVGASSGIGRVLALLLPKRLTTCILRSELPRL